MKCTYCYRECKNSNSLRNHERLCSSNPHKTSFPDRSGEKNPHYGKAGGNQFTKAKALGLEKPPGTAKKGQGLGIKKMSASAKKKISEARSRYIEEQGKGGFLKVKYYDIANIRGEAFKVRGLWELRYAEYLNANNIFWVRRIYLKYKDANEIERTYTPDFYLPEEGVYKEVKGFFSEKDKEKIRLVSIQNKLKIDILFREDLESLGIKLR